MDKKLLFIVNPRAGRTKSFAPLFDAVACFSKAGYLVKVFLTEGRGDATRAAAELGGAYDLVVCAGGDGTFNEMVSGLMQLPECPEVGYLPQRQHQRLCRQPAYPRHAAEGGGEHRKRPPLLSGCGPPQRPILCLCGLLRGLYPQLLLRATGHQERSGSLRLYSGGHEGSGLPAALPLPGGDGRGDLRGGSSSSELCATPPLWAAS